MKFLQSVAQVMLTKARMKLNIKRLYAADGNAVKELLKLASLLYKATSKAGDVDEVGRVVGGRVGWQGATHKGPRPCWYLPRCQKQLLHGEGPRSGK